MLVWFGAVATPAFVAVFGVGHFDEEGDRGEEAEGWWGGDGVVVQMLMCG